MKTVTWNVWVMNAAGAKRHDFETHIEAEQFASKKRHDNMKNRNIIDGPVPRVKDEYLQRSN